MTLSQNNYLSSLAVFMLGQKHCLKGMMLNKRLHRNVRLNR